MRKNIGSIIVSVLVAFVLFSGVVWAPAEERRIPSGVMIGPLYLQDGTSTDPSMAINSEKGTGFFLTKVGKLGLAIDGTGLVTTFDAVKGIDTVGSGTFGTDLTVGGTTILGDANSDGLTFKPDTVNWTSTNDIHNVYSSDVLNTGAAVMRFVTSFQIEGSLDVEGTDGIGIFPGSDIDTNIFIVGVTGSPKAFWDESEDKLSFTKGIIHSDSKAGTVAGASFAGNPKVYTVTFGTVFPNTNYSITIAGEDNRTFTYQTKLAASFIINSNANLAFAGNVDWTATAHSDP